VVGLLSVRECRLAFPIRYGRICSRWRSGRIALIVVVGYWSAVFFLYLAIASSTASVFLRSVRLAKALRFFS